MDIKNIGKNGGVERSGDRPKRTESKRDDAAPVVQRDEAQISESSRATAAAAESLADKARRGDSEREPLVVAAMKKLMAGGLDGEAAIRDTAQKLLDSRFLSA